MFQAAGPGQRFHLVPLRGYNAAVCFRLSPPCHRVPSPVLELPRARSSDTVYGQLEGRVTVELYGTSWTDIMVVILDNSYVFLPPREQSLTPGTHFSHLGPRRRH